MKGILSQNSFISGEINPLALSRRDINQYRSGLKTAHNVMILPQGGLVKRPAFANIGLVTDNTALGSPFMVPFIFGDNVNYVVVLTKDSLGTLWFSFYRENVFLEKQALTIIPIIASNVWAALDLSTFRFTQNGDLMVLTHGQIPPISLQRQLQGTHTTFSLALISFTAMPQYQFTVGSNANAWDANHGWPQICAFYQNRLFFAATNTLPQTLWASKTGLFYDFGISSPLQDTDSLSITLASTSLNYIQSIYAGLNLFLFTNTGEWYNSNAPLTPNTIGDFQRQSEYGSSKLMPCVMDQGIVFHQNSSNIIRICRWDFVLDTYTSQSLSYLGGHLINNPVSMTSIKGAPPFGSSYLFVVNTNGTMAVANLDSNQGILNWVQWQSQCQILQTVAATSCVYLTLQEPGGKRVYLARVDSSYSYDLGVIATNANIGSAAPANYTFTLPASYNNLAFDFIGDSTFLGKFTIPSNGQVALPQGFTTYQGGYPISMKMETLPLSFNNAGGDAYGQKKRVIRVLLDLLSSSSFTVTYANQVWDATHIFEATGGPPQYINGRVSFPLLGFVDVATVQIQQNSPLPFNLLGIEMEVGI